MPLSTLAALVARRPSVCPLASTTYHLRLISLPLGINVDISLLPSKKSLGAPPSPIRVSCESVKVGKQNPNHLGAPGPWHLGTGNPQARTNRIRPCKTHGPRNLPTAKQFCSGEKLREFVLIGTLAAPDLVFPSPAAGGLLRWSPLNSFQGIPQTVRVSTPRPQAQHRARTLEY